MEILKSIVDLSKAQRHNIENIQNTIQKSLNLEETKKAWKAWRKKIKARDSNVELA